MTQEKAELDIDVSLYVVTFAGMLETLREMYEANLQAIHINMKAHQLDSVSLSNERNEKLREEYLVIYNLSSRFQRHEKINDDVEAIEKARKKIKSKLRELNSLTKN